jgi:hypothetical protein
MLRVPVLAILLSLVSTPWAVAQDQVPLRPGVRVRVTSQDCGLRRAKGTLLFLEGDLLGLRVGDTDVECPVRAVRRLEVPVGEKPVWTASLAGLGIGAGAGLVFTLALKSQAGPYDDMWPILATIGAMGLTTLGLIGGTVHGVTRDRERWEPVRLERHPHSGLRSRRGRIEFAFHISPRG